MRNFKKFLALVLAMLMVSACAISVSAFADQAAINASRYKDAINKMAELKILIGDGNGNLNPTKNLTRAQAAKIFALLDTGVVGQKLEWKDAYCVFEDVKAEWSFAYINYCVEHDIMHGKGDGLFHPDDTITVAEVLTMAVQAYDAAYEQFAIYEIDGAGKPWYLNYVKAAKDYNLYKGVGTTNFEAPITTAQIAQVAFNLFSENGDTGTKSDSGVAKKFVTTTVTGTVTYDDNYVIVDDTLKFTTAAFAEESAKHGITDSYQKLAADKTEIKVVYQGTTIFEMNVSKKYDSVSVTKAPQEANKDVEKIIVDGKTYATTSAAVGSTSDIVGGSAGLKMADVKIIDGRTSEAYTKGALPEFFSATVFEKADGDVEVNIYKYHLGTVKKDGTIKKENAKCGAEIDKIVTTGYKFNNSTDELIDDKARKVVVNPADFAFSAETPVIFAVSFDDNAKTAVIDVKQVAKIVTGKVDAYSSHNHYITIDGKEYKYLNDTMANPDTLTLNQNISIYTINDKFVQVTNSSVQSISLYVDNVTVVNGKAVVEGYEKGTFAAKTLIVSGYLDGKFYDREAHELPNTNNNGSKTYAGPVTLGIYNASNKTWTDDVPCLLGAGFAGFQEGGLYTFDIVDDKVYLVSNDNENISDYAADVIIVADVNAEDAATDYFEVKNGYVYLKDIAQYHFSGKIMNANVKSGEDGKPFYATTYTISDSFAKKTSVSYKLKKAADKENTISFIWVEGGNVVTSTSNVDIPAIRADETLVQVLDAEPIEAAYSYFTYSAVNVLTGEALNVKFAKKVDEGGYYIVKDGFITEGNYNADLFIKEVEITVDDQTSRVITTYKAKANKVVQTTTVGASGTTVSYKTVELDEKEFGIDSITILKATSGVIDMKNGKAVTEKLTDVLTATATYTAYAVAGKIVLIHG